MLFIKQRLVLAQGHPPVLKRHFQVNKTDLLVEEVELIETNPKRYLMRITTLFCPKILLKLPLPNWILPHPLRLPSDVAEEAIAPRRSEQIQPVWK